MRKTWFWNITWKMVGFYLLFWMFFAVLYWVTLFLTSGVDSYRFYQVGTQYTAQALVTIPFYYLFFIKLKDIPFHKKLLLHILCGPGYILFSVLLYHWSSDRFQIQYLEGRAIFWDIYLPLLYYLIQFSAFHIYYFYIEQKEFTKKQRELQFISYQSELNALKAQIKPHFLFNTLNSISASVPSNLEHTRNLIAKLADTFRFALTSSQEDKIYLRNEMDFIKSYLELEQVRFNDRLHVIYTIDDHLLNILIPPMLLQPIIENALIHGIAKSVDGGSIQIIVKQIESKIYFEVADTGVGIQSADLDLLTAKGVGLRNIRQRLLMQYKEELTVMPNSPQGLRIIFFIS